MKYLINMAYNGSKFYGYAKQPNFKTVQGEIEKYLSIRFNKDVTTQIAGRTDKGVHAINQYCHFVVEEEIDINKLKIYLNNSLEKNIIIKNINKVSNNFHARYHVKEKEYLYKINIGDFSLFEKDYILQYNKKLNINLMKKASKKIIGKHNFERFTSIDDKKETYIREVNNIKIEKNKNYIYIYVSGKGFLKYMVRNIVGLLIEISENKKTINDINKIFNKEKNIIPRKIDACGLYLNKINFEGEKNEQRN